MRNAYDDGAGEVPVPDAAAELRTVLELTGFQRDLLLVIAGIGSPRPSGRTVRQALEDLWETDVNESRVYQNLTELRDRDLVESRPIDGRTKGYRITDPGRSLLETYRAWSEACLRVAAEDDDGAGGR